MDQTVASGSGAVQPTAQRFEPPHGWHEVQQSLAIATGLSILLVHGEQPPEIDISNNNSICAAFQSSETHRHLCRPFCGTAFENCNSAGGPIYYRCHAGLHCVAVPVQLTHDRTDAVIGGRTFLRSADSRAV